MSVQQHDDVLNVGVRQRKTLTDQEFFQPGTSTAPSDDDDDDDPSKVEER